MMLSKVLGCTINIQLLPAYMSEQRQALSTCLPVVQHRFAKSKSEKISFSRHAMHVVRSVVCVCLCKYHTHTRLTALFPGLPRSAGTRKVKPIWILLKQESVSGSGISWVICKSAPCSVQTTTPAPHHSVSYRPDALPAAQPTASKH